MATSYSTGTVSIANGATALTGSGTAWSTNGVQAGDIFEANGLTIEIASVASDTSITLARAWPGATLSGNNYSIRFTPVNTRVLVQTNTLLAQLGNGILTGLSNVASPAADKLAYMTGAATWGLIDFKAAARTALELGSASSPTFAGLTTTGVHTLAGGQIAFPATQNPSAGANVLDDYEEGEWTMELQFGGASTGITYGANGGYYTKIGRLVALSGYLLLTSKGSSTGTAGIAGLPFASSLSTRGYTSGGLGLHTNMASLSSIPAWSSQVGQPSILLRHFGAGSTIASVTNAHFNDNSGLMLNILYQI